MIAMDCGVSSCVVRSLRGIRVGNSARSGSRSGVVARTSDSWSQHWQRPPAMSKDNNRLSRLGVLAPAALAACMDASMLAVPAAGAIVSTVLKELSKAFMLKKWFHGIMSAKEAEHLIMEKGKNGSFLVRESQAHPGEFVLSVRVRGRVSHVMIHRRDDKYDVGSGEQFDDLVGLIEHFRSYPMIETSGDVLRLLQPVSGTCVRARDIDRKVHEMEKSDDPQRFAKNGFDGEFQSLWLLEERQAFSTDEGEKLENATKNRYRNVLPYDHTRVVLRKRDHCPGSGGSDYINASHIRPSSLRDCFNSSSNESLNSVHSLRLYSEPKRTKSSVPLVSKSLSDEALEEIARCVNLQKMNENVFQHVVRDKSYIATQGCLQSTRADFWQMIWQEDARIIAMIANEVEKGKKKCDRYWPLSGSEEKFDALTIRSVSETFYEEYLVRELEVCAERTCRTVYQYQFTAWPDHGTPPDPDGVLAYLDDINKKMVQISQSRHAPQKNVICVHCSAGVGRTGTFIVLDMLIDQIKSSGYSCDIDVYNTVKLVRSCRKGMVQNRAQYKFIYQALQQYIDNKNLKLRKKVYTSDA